MNNLFKKIKIFLTSFLADPLFLSRWEEPWRARPHNDNQLSIRVSGSPRRKKYLYQGDSLMFIEDMYTGIIPYMFYEGEREKYTAKIEPSTPQKEIIIAEGISKHSHFLSDALCDTPRPKGGASSGQVGPADYRLLRGHLPFIGRRCFYWGSHPPIPLRIKIYLGGICPPNPLTGMPFLPAQRAGLPGIVSEFVRESAHLLFSYGNAIYEIIYQKNDSNEIKSFELALLQPFYLFRFGKNYYQIIPWWEAKKSRTRVQIIRIPAEKILRIDFPKQYGGKRKIHSTLKRLSQLSREYIPDFQMKAIERNENIGFDLNEFVMAKYLEKAKITQHFGWDQRQYSDNYITEYYFMVRFLRKMKLEAMLRTYIISKLNEVINRAPLNLNTTISINNLFSVEKVQELEGCLKRGDVGFKKIFNALKI